MSGTIWTLDTRNTRSHNIFVSLEFLFLFLSIAQGLLRKTKKEWEEEEEEREGGGIGGLEKDRKPPDVRVITSASLNELNEDGERLKRSSRVFWPKYQARDARKGTGDTPKEMASLLRPRSVIYKSVGYNSSDIPYSWEHLQNASLPSGSFQRYNVWIQTPT